MIKYILTLLLIPTLCYAETTKASWYSKASCIKEGTWSKYNGKMANGEVFNENRLTCASWDYDFGTRLKVTNISNGKSVKVTVTDRGPSKRLYRKGRKLDLSSHAFEKIAELKEGVILVDYEIVKD